MPGTTDKVVLREQRRNLAEAFDRLTELPEDVIEAIEEKGGLKPENRAR